jgi:8-oxo-dGTP pyrophosphatase MutT (NUDIX family)
MDSAIREAKEETDLDVFDLRPLTTYLDTESTDEAVIISFTARTKNSGVKLSWEHEAFRWLTREELDEIQLPDLHDSIRKAFLQLPF